MTAVAPRPVRALRRVPPPLRLLFGPVFQRDMRALGRRRSTYAIRFCFTLGLTGLAMLIAGSIALNTHAAGAVARQQALQDIAPALTLTVGWFGFVCLCFASIVVAAGAICDERHKRTLPALMTTPVTAAEIAFSMLASRFVQLAILALTALPVLLAARTFGGAPLQTVLAFTTISLSAALLGIACSLLASVGARRASTAASLAFAMLNAIFFGPIILLLFFQLGMPNSTAWLEHTAILSAPIAAMAVTADLIGGGAPTIPVDTIWVGNTLANTALAIVFTALAAATLRRRIRLDTEGVTTAASALGTTTRRQRRRAKRTAANTKRAARRAERSARARTISDEPVLWREWRQPLHTSRAFARTVAAVAVVGLALLPIRVGIGDEVAYYLPVVFGVFIIAFLAGSTPAATIAGERESRTWETLLTTRVPRHEIVLGKYLGALRKQLLAPLLIAFYLAIIGIPSRHLQPLAPAHILLILLGPILVFTATGLLASMLSKNPTRAATLNIGLVLVLYAGLPFLTALLADFFNVTDDLVDAIEEPFLLIHPLAAAVLSIDGAHASTAARFPREYDIADIELTRGAYTVAVAAVFVAHAVIAAVVLGTTRALFNRLAPRAS